MAPRWPPAPWWPPASSCLPQSWERFPSARCLRQKAGRGRVGREGSIGAGVVLEQRELPLHLLKRGCVAMLTKLKRGFVIFYVFQKHLITQYVSIYFRAFWLSLSTSYCLKHRWLDHEKPATLCVGPGGGVWNGRRNPGWWAAAALVEPPRPTWQLQIWFFYSQTDANYKYACTSSNDHQCIYVPNSSLGI